MGRFRIKLSERKEYETKSKTKRDGGHEFSPLSRPGTSCHGRFYRPGNWASNIAAGSGYGYELLWMVTLSTIMLIFLQHNAAHLGIVTGKCLSEAASSICLRG